MYGGSAYSYANDPDFMWISTSEKFWQKVIDAFYEKYFGFRQWHEKIVQEAMHTGQLIMPTGRIYTFEPTRNFRGELVAPETIIKNYPVQGLGADIMSIIRILFFRRFKDAGINGYLVNTVHDSIVADIHKGEVDRVASIFNGCFSDFPNTFKRIFGVEFDLPLLCEISVGNNMKELTDYV